jgi:Transcriptional regulator PadR-like family
MQGELLQGTLDLLILRTLALGPAHGHTIAHAIEQRSEDVLQVEHGSLYPALHRLEDRGWISSFWGIPRTIAAPVTTASHPEGVRRWPNRLLGGTRSSALSTGFSVPQSEEPYGLVSVLPPRAVG